jgi:hypothetical protein
MNADKNLISYPLFDRRLAALIGGSSFFRPLRHPDSEYQLQRELALPRGVGGPNGAEGGTGRLGVGYPEVGVVQNVEELPPELEPGPFADPEVLVD